jgi:octaprenyl-diphosphate synthase
LYEPIQSPLSEVRGTMDRLWLDALELVGVDGAGASRAGGKLLRPALCLMAAGALGAADLKRYVRLAAAFESLHIASLAHDDVLDRALLRRGAASLSGLWDNHAAVLGGDYLVARAVEMLAEYDSCTVIAKAIRSVRRMAEGELFFFNRDRASITHDDCIMLARQKTASLFAEACSAPSYVVAENHRDDLYEFGDQLGIAFQLVDDILDITQPTDKLGKPACGDVVEGKRTIPILFLRDALQGADRERLDAMENAEITDADREWIIEQAHETGARERAEALTHSYAARAREAVRRLPESPFRDAMEGVVEFVLIRGA